MRMVLTDRGKYRQNRQNEQSAEKVAESKEKGKILLKKIGY